jgi:antitoxin MazE
MKTKIQRWGNSQGLRFPRHVLRRAHISVGDEVEIISRKDSIVVKPSRAIRGRYDLKVLASRMPRSYKPSEEDWGSKAGKEVW